NPAAVKPIVVVAEARDAVLLREGRLRLPHFWQPQVIEAKIGGKVWLIMCREKRPRIRDVAPLGKSRPPPFVILRDGMVLGKIKRYGTNAWPGGGRNHCRICLGRNLQRRCLSRSVWDRLSTFLIAPALLSNCASRSALTFAAVCFVR